MPIQFPRCLLVFAVALGSAGCVPPRGQNTTPGSVVGILWDYEVSVDATGTTLSISGDLTGASPLLGVDKGAEMFVSDFEVAPYDATKAALFQPVAREQEGWRADACTRRCRIRYRFRLVDAARAIQDSSRLQWVDGIVVGSASAWLVHPAPQASVRYRFRINAAPSGMHVVSGVAALSPDVYGAAATELEDGPYTAFGAFHRKTVVLGTSTLEVAITQDNRFLSDEAIIAWVVHSARTIQSYLGFFPVERALILATSSSFDDVRGQTSGGGGSAILLSIGTRATAWSLSKGGVLTHEMVHLALPYMTPLDQWFTEGLAVYIEAVARARAGDLDESAFWTHLQQHLPLGLPRHDEQGLRGATRAGRVYWGGGLFFLLADLEVRQCTGNAHAIVDILRAVHANGGSVAEHWTVDRTIDVGDAATGTTTLRTLYEQMGKERVDTDLDALWAKLGLEFTREGIRFNNRAPWAEIRAAIMEH